MPRRPETIFAGPAYGLLPIVILIIAVVAIFLPISPTISGGFTVSAQGGTVQVGFTSLTYTKSNLITGLSAQNGVLTITSTPATIGTYTINIYIRYGTISDFGAGVLSPILSQQISGYGDGTYLFRALFLFRQESTSVPYIVTILVTGPTITQAQVSAVIAPS